MRIWPDPKNFDNWQDWADQLRQTLVEQEQEAAFAQAEIGQVAEFATPVLPTGWLEADGSTFDSPSFPVLAQRLGGTTLPSLSPQYDAGNLVAIKAA